MLRDSPSTFCGVAWTAHRSVSRTQRIVRNSSISSPGTLQRWIKVTSSLTWLTIMTDVWHVNCVFLYGIVWCWILMNLSETHSALHNKQQKPGVFESPSSDFNRSLFPWTQSQSQTHKHPHRMKPTSSRLKLRLTALLLPWRHQLFQKWKLTTLKRYQT